MPKRSNTGRIYGKAKRARAARRTGPVRRRRYRRRTRIGRPSRGLRQSTYLFKRQTTEVIPLLATGSTEHGWYPSSGTGSDPGIYKQWAFSLNQLAQASTEGSTDFTNLFKRYKICAVKLELSFSNTQAAVSSVNSGTASAPNCQLQVYTTPNRSGRSRTAANPLTEQELMHTQAKQKRLAINGGRPLTYYMRVNQLGMVYVSTTDTDYGVQRPQYISTGETGCVHYGLEMYINRVDGNTLSSGITTNQFMRCTTTYYLAFKGVE